MPLGFERLNERSQRPNACINFINPLANANLEDHTIAKNFLERIAAQCYPVMKKEYISVMALEEYPPNPEFLGRNFNAGEVIQLVLKDKAGRWLSFKFVQMVMMHELAHCKQMNHSRAFWKERNRFAEQMEGLWAAGYKGEGVWGRGQDLTTGRTAPDRMPEGVDIPEHLCGGTYRFGRGRKRKRGQDGGEKLKLTHAERQQKRIAKKFGVHGEGKELDGDELVRGALEQGKRSYGKPRVANSKRGRELRANAALARFEAAKSQPPEKTPELDDDAGSETESDADEYADGLDVFTTLEKIKDQSGRDLYKVCGDEAEQDEGGQNELADLNRMRAEDRTQTDRASASRPQTGPAVLKQDDSETESEPEDIAKPSDRDRNVANGSIELDHQDSETEDEPEIDETATGHPHVQRNGSSAKSSTSALSESSSAPQQSIANDAGATTTTANCPICSLENAPDSPTCMACLHVLKPSLMRNHWRCRSEQCKGNKYINPGDAGRCGLCGSQKPAAGSATIGVVPGEVLRWD